MDALQTLVATAFATLISSIIVLLITKIIETKHAHDLENYKTQLQMQYDQFKADLENQWQTRLFEYQTKFASLHQQRAESIRQIYGMMADTNQHIINLVHPVQFTDDLESAKQSTVNKYQALAEFYTQNRIYLDEDICEKIDSVLHVMRSALRKWMFSQNHLHNERSLQSWDEAYKSMQDEVPLILAELEKQFRQALLP